MSHSVLKCFLEKKGNEIYLIPADGQDKAGAMKLLDKFGEEEPVYFKTSNQRNNKHLRHFFGWLNIVLPFSPFEEVDELRWALSYMSGRFRDIEINGKKHPFPLSISFENMNEEEFTVFEKSCKREWWKYVAGRKEVGIMQEEDIERLHHLLDINDQQI